MRIGFVSTYPPIECGIATYTQFLNEEIRKQGKETFIVSQVGARGDNVFPVYWPESISIAAQIFNTSARITPDVIHIQHEFGIFGSQRGVQVVDLVLRYKMAGIPVVATLHTVNDKMTLEEETILRIMVNECDAIIVHEQYQKETLLRYFGKAVDKSIHVIPHGVRDVPNISDAKQKLNLDGKKVVLMCGYFRENKQFHKIVELWPEICKQTKDTVLLLAGKTQGLIYSDYQHQLFETVNTSPVNDRIMVLRGQFPQKTFDTILAASDVAVFPYTFGGQSGIMAHCFAFDKPVVASNIRAFRDSVEASKGGVICETDKEYVDAIVKMLNDEDYRQSLSINIRKHTAQTCLWSVVVPQYFLVYESVIQVPYGKAKYAYFG